MSSKPVPVPHVRAVGLIAPPWKGQPATGSPTSTDQIAVCLRRK